MNFADPKNDMAFKKIFGDASKKETLMSFLNAVLGYEEGERIIDVELAHPYQVPRIEELKNTLLDVKARDQSGREFIVEMQMEWDMDFGKRSLYYAAKSYVGQLKQGMDYRHLKPVVFLGILNFNLFDGAGVITRHVLVNQANQKRDLKDFEFNFIELPKFKKRPEELTSEVDWWIDFFKGAENRIEIPIDAPKALQRAYETAQQFSWSKEELEVYDYVSVQEGARLSELNTALERGKRVGREEGMKEGERQKALLIAKRLVESGMSKQEAAQITGLSLEDW